VACPPDPLVAPGDLSRFNVPGEFLARFRRRPFQVQVVTAGALGALAVQWRFLGDEAYSETIYSSAGASWQLELDDAYAVLTFAAATYQAAITYTVDANGNVTGGAGELTASMLDMVAQACATVTGEALILMADAIKPPLSAWGDEIRQHAANMAYAALKRGKGATPKGVGAGDDHIFLAEDAARRFFGAIGKGGKPDSVVDSSVSSDGPMLAAYPWSRPPRGW
jgi:hypothetical protein